MQYCKELLEKYPLTHSELTSKNYEKMEELNFGDRPRYDWYETDYNGTKVIHITHYNPNGLGGYTSEESMPEIGYTFTWGMKDKKNIVTDWNPQVDTMSYLIRKAMYERTKEKVEKGQINFDEITQGVSSDYKRFIEQAYKDDVLRDEQSIIEEHYDAEITLVGVPADPPISAILTIYPRILESVSRTAGKYLVRGSSDHITNNGVYTTTIQLFRIDDAAGSYEAYRKQLAAKNEAISANGGEASNSKTEAVNIQNKGVLSNTPTSIPQTIQQFKDAHIGNEGNGTSQQPRTKTPYTN